MNTPSRINASLAIFATAIMLISSTGCNTQQQVSDQPNTPSASFQTPQTPGKSESHNAWWCGEHGVPEDQCGRCDSRLAAEFQRQGNWCQDHNRPDTQCFVCHPEYQEQFASLYVAKYGKAPPSPTE